MNSSILNSLLILFIFLLFPSSSQMIWEEYCVKFNKNCSDLQRRQNYEKRVASWDNIISFVPRENNMSDWSQQQIKNFFHPIKIDTSSYNYQVSSSQPSRKLGTPNSYDYRNDGIVTSVKYQGSCSSCWSFTATAMAESKLIKDKRYPNTIDLSEMYLLKCTPGSTCNGGDMWQSSKNSRTMATQQDHPYQPYQSGSPGICSTNTIRIAPQAFQKKRYYKDDIEAMLLEYGPLSIVLEADEEDWINYGSGVYECPTSFWPDEINHAVLLIGYTEDYWIIKNSWGSWWGQNGYMRIKRKFFNCEIGTALYYLSGTYDDPTDPGIDGDDGGDNGGGDGEDDEGDNGGDDGGDDGGDGGDDGGDNGGDDGGGDGGDNGGDDQNEENDPQNGTNEKVPPRRKFEMNMIEILAVSCLLLLCV